MFITAPERQSGESHIYLIQRTTTTLPVNTIGLSSTYFDICHTLMEYNTYNLHDFVIC